MTSKIKEKLIKSLFLEINAEELAKEKGFIRQSWHTQITPYGYVLGFFRMFSKGMNSLECWANNIYEITGELISKQAVDGRFYDRHVNFVRSLFDKALNNRVSGEFRSHISLFKAFGRVLLVDSSCISINRQLSQWFKGSYSSRGEAATLRIQTTYDIKAEDIDSVEIQSFRDNDQKHSANILTKAKPGDLVLRDLGYFSLKVFAKMVALKIYFVSRLTLGVTIYDAESKKKIDLLKFLTDSGQTIDKEVLVGKLQVPMRLVAEKLPAEVAMEKQEKAKKDRNKKANHSEEHMALLCWTILITNVPSSIWSVKQLLGVYVLRWRIEILFKAWKSSLNLDNILHVKMKHNRFLITVYLSLLYIVLFCQPAYKDMVLHEGKVTPKKGISIIKFYDWMKNNFDRFIQLESIDDFVRNFGDEIRRYCSHDIHKKRISYVNLLYEEFRN